MSVDTDMNDIWIWHALDSVYKPRVVIVFVLWVLSCVSACFFRFVSLYVVHVLIVSRCVVVNSRVQSCVWSK